MSSRSIRELKGVHANQDIWIIAAGASMNYVSPSFFDNKVSIGINRVCKYFDCDYVVSKDGRGFGNIIESKRSSTKILLSKYESGNLHQNLNKINEEHYIFEHPAKPREEPLIDEISKSSDKIVVSYSTITSGIHIAAYMGAKNIIICGHDCGTIDGESTIDGYYSKIRPHQGNNDGYVRWLSQIENHTTKVCFKIQNEYGCNVHSLNPFINFNLEGHKYVPSNNGTLLQRSRPKPTEPTVIPPVQ